MGKFQGVIRPGDAEGNALGEAKHVPPLRRHGLPIRQPPERGHVKGHVNGFLHVAPRFSQHLAHLAHHLKRQDFFPFLHQPPHARQESRPAPARASAASRGKRPARRRLRRLCLRRGTGQTRRWCLLVVGGIGWKETSRRIERNATGRGCNWFCRRKFMCVFPVPCPERQGFKRANPRLRGRRQSLRLFCPRRRGVAFLKHRGLAP